MEVKVKQLNGWECALDMARFTVNKGELNKVPSDRFKYETLIDEHSPIREVRFLIQMLDVKTWIAQHFARHDFGGEHHAMDCAAVQYGATQREDRTGIHRDDLKQSELTNHSMTVNAQDLINMSRKRLCIGGAHKETLAIWGLVKDEISKIDPIMAKVMVKECVYRGFCPSMNNCGYTKTKTYLSEYGRYTKL